MVTQSTLAGTTRRSMLGQFGMLLLIGLALGVFGMYMLDSRPGRISATKPGSPAIAGAIHTSPGQDVLSVEWLEQQRATQAATSAKIQPQNDVLSVEWLEQQRAANATVLSSVKTQDDVLSVEWLEQHRQSNPNEANAGSRAGQPNLDNYIGFIE